MAPVPGMVGINQVAVVVHDINIAMRHYVEDWGIGPWHVYTYGPKRLHTMTFRGEDCSYVMKLALSYVGETMYELIEHIEGPTTYAEFLASNGEGLHHLGYYVPDIDDEIERMTALGYPLLQSGRGFGVDGDGAFAYFDSESRLGCIVEAIELPKAMPEAEEIYPASSS
jgi:methylmalonyl-CoA/ethylmalonyl-CoA epimerase